MRLSRSDETDLLVPLIEGLVEEPRWSTFLDRLRRRTRADHVSLIVGQGREQVSSATQWFAGADVRARAAKLADFAALDPTPYHSLRSGRVYDAAEMIDPDNPDHRRFRDDYLDRIGITHARYMRVAEPEGRSALLVIVRGRDDFTAADGAILSALAPHLAVALRLLGRFEAAQFRTAVAEDALVRAGIGWQAVDERGRVLTAGGDRGEGEPDAGSPPARIVAAADGEAGVVLAVSVAPPAHFAREPASAILLSRHPRATGPQHAAALAQQFGLSASEARLALCLAAGRSLAEAATTVGLTLETARNYSKRLFEKTGTRGQADLVRRIVSSVAMLA